MKHERSHVEYLLKFIHSKLDLPYDKEFIDG